MNTKLVLKLSQNYQTTFVKNVIIKLIKTYKTSQLVSFNKIIATLSFCQSNYSTFKICSGK